MARASSCSSSVGLIETVVIVGRGRQVRPACRYGGGRPARTPRPGLGPQSLLLRPMPRGLGWVRAVERIGHSVPSREDGPERLIAARRCAATAGKAAIDPPVRLWVRSYGICERRRVIDRQLISPRPRKAGQPTRFQVAFLHQSSQPKHIIKLLLTQRENPCFEPLLP
jgi:hypothetical protein